MADISQDAGPEAEARQRKHTLTAVSCYVQRVLVQMEKPLAETLRH